MAPWCPPVTPPPTRRPLALVAPDAFKGTATAPAVAAAMAAGRPAGGLGQRPVPACPTAARASPTSSPPRPGPTGPRPGPWHHDDGDRAPRTTRSTARWWLAGAGGGGGVGGGLGACPWPAGPRATTRCGPPPRGTGELLVAAVAAGARRVLVGVGGSATTDGGRGAVEAIERGRRPRAGSRWWWPVTSRPGSSRPPRDFGPQKGATPDQVVELEPAPGGAGRPTSATRYGVDVTDLPGPGRRRRSGRGAGRPGGAPRARASGWWPTPSASRPAWPGPTWWSPGRGASTPRRGRGRWSAPWSAWPGGPGSPSSWWPVRWARRTRARGRAGAGAGSGGRWAGSRSASLTDSVGEAAALADPAGAAEDGGGRRPRAALAAAGRARDEPRCATRCATRCALSAGAPPGPVTPARPQGGAAGRRWPGAAARPGAGCGGSRTPRSTWAIGSTPKCCGHVDQQAQLDAVARRPSRVFSRTQRWAAVSPARGWRTPDSCGEEQVDARAGPPAR